jgi:hypothetical protein
MQVEHDLISALRLHWLLGPTSLFDGTRPRCEN